MRTLPLGVARRGRRHARILLASFAVILGPIVLANAQDPPRLRRADSFLGIHFDFHAGEDCKEVGKGVDAAMVERIVDLVHPDYLQVDCKGHPGVSSYPTKVGHPAPGFVGDPLRIWREVTARRGVGLFMHYSGVWDSNAVKEHPEWAAVDAAGKPSPKATSVFGPYAEERLIPQLRELAGVYGVDGAWVDGDCWAAVADYSPAALAAFREATGIEQAPRKPGDPHWRAFLDFQRDAFRRYLCRDIAAVKATNPGFQYCSNWAFTDHMPEPVAAPVDFLSGDFSPEDSVNSARLSGRFLARQGKPWDLMAWGFATKPTRQHKTAVQLQREAAVILALGGGFQAYFNQRRDGSVPLELMPVMAEVARFCRERQALCHRAEAVPQVAVLFSTAAHYRQINSLFGRDNARVAGVLQALLDAQNSVELLAEHHLIGRMGEYPLIVVPEWEYLEPSFRDALVSYAKGGGNLLLIGPRTVALFASEIGEVTDGGPTIKPLGRGRIAAMPAAFGQAYQKSPDEGARRLLNDLVRRLVPEPVVEVTGSPSVDVCPARQGGKLLVSLVNVSGPHRTEPILESIEPVGPLSVTIRTKDRPGRVSLQPAGIELPFEFREGTVQLTVPKVSIHEVVVVEP
ncbi:MAG: alpha-amylase family protein [Isosphaeraceae bacterium]